MKIKKVQSVCLILACAAVTCVAVTGLIGCGKTDETSKKHEAITFMAPYLEVDSFIEEVHKTYPEVNLEVITYSGSNTTTYLQNMLEADDLPDICTQTFYKPDVVDVSDKMIDLSGYDFTDNYVESRLKEVSDDGALYMLPSLYNCYGITYNKTLLEQHGWKLPISFTELEELADKAKEAGVTLCMAQIQYPGSAFQYICNIADAGFLGTLSGKQWQKDYLSGKANVSDTEGMMDSMEYIQKWKDLEVLCDSIFHPLTGTPMDELFTRYMYYERAKQGIKSSTTEALRKFYERNAYSLLKNDQTFENLIDLANFWNDVQNQNVERFSDKVLRRLFVLNYAPNGMWTYFVSVYYMANRDSNGFLDDNCFYGFLNKITAFIWAYAVTNPGVNALRTPIFAEMINLVNRQPVQFTDYLFHTQQLQNAFNNYVFSNNRAITKAMLTWWAFQNSHQELLSLESVLEIEHIYARSRQEKEHSLSNPRNIESLGNKALLEKRINIRASDYRFSDKVKYYTGFENNRKQRKEGTKIEELTVLAATATDFTESDIVERNAKIIFNFIEFMHSNDLLCED